MRHDDSIGYKMRLIHNQVRKRMDAKRQANEGNLTGMQHWTLDYLKEQEGKEICQRDLEEVFSVSRATVSNMLRVMERENLVKRVSVEQDARLKKLVLTEKAQHMVEQASRDVEEMERTITTGMNAEEITQLKGYLDRILENLGVEPEEEERRLMQRELGRPAE
ncbi:MAG: MarR family winged helix-turn-helix transcriptional regulator [Roseburia sp.]